MAKPSTPPSGRPAQGAGRSIPIEDTRGAAGDSQPSANQADTGTGSSAPSSEPGATAAAADPKGPACGRRRRPHRRRGRGGPRRRAGGGEAHGQRAGGCREGRGCQEWQDKFMRLHAEWDTYRRRTNGAARGREGPRDREAGHEPASRDRRLRAHHRLRRRRTARGELLGRRAAPCTPKLRRRAEEGRRGGDRSAAGEAFDALEAQAVATVDDRERARRDGATRCTRKVTRLGIEGLAGPRW